jgi:hypothetical protein
MKKIILTLGIMGTLFAGYLSAAKLLAKTCPFGESCRTFLGYPTCYFGFGLFALITLLAAFLVLNRIKEERGFSYIAFVSLTGVLFAGYFTLQEVPLLFERGLSAYFFGLPTCALGLIFFILIFGLSINRVMKFED